jgi:hypothetical protein
VADPVHYDTSVPAINAAGRFIMCLEPEGQSESGLGAGLLKNRNSKRQNRTEEGIEKRDRQRLDGRVWGHWSVDAL